MTVIVPKIRFEKSGYFFIALMLIAFAGFWNSYFSKFFNGNNEYNFYFHFHAVLAILWMVMLIVQPLLIRKKMMAAHRKLGKASYILMPLLLISVLLLLNSQLKSAPPEILKFNNIAVVIRDILMLSVFFAIAIRNRHKIQIHARAMIVTGIVFIEPAMARLMGRVIFKGQGPVGFLVTGSFILLLLITLIILERKQKTARWVFPLALSFYLVTYTILFSEIDIPFLDAFVKWFAALPLTQ